jgi:lactate racemase
MDEPNRLSEIDDLLAALASGALQVAHLEPCDVVLRALDDPPPIDVPSVLAAALDAPLDSAPLHALAAGRSTAAVITSDATRAVPNRLLLPGVLDELERGGLAPQAVTVVVGGGAHRPATREELERMFGQELLRRVQVVTHDARRDVCVDVGTTPAGTPVRVNRIVADADLRIAFGVVEPHEFAGFTGGRKAVLPGVAAYETILRNHRLEAIAHERARPGVLEGNPAHEDMLAALGLAPLDFAVNVTLDRRLRPTALAAGSAEAVHAALTGVVRRTATLEVAQAPDLLITGPGAPLDLNFYQAMKALVAVEPLVGPDTVVVLLAACRDGLGSADLLAPFEGGGAPGDVVGRAAADYTVQKDHSYFLARFLARCPHVVALCPGVADADLRRLRSTPAATLETALAEAVGRARRLSRRARPTALLLPRPQRALFTVVPPPAAAAAGVAPPLVPPSLRRPS